MLIIRFFMKELMNNSKVIYKEKAICEICDSDNFEKYIETEDFDTHLGAFEILKCKNCGMYYTSPHPTKETLHYLYDNRCSKNFDGENWSFFEAIKDFFAEQQLKAYLKKLNFKPKSFADFGTGNARYALTLKRLCPDSEVVAIDFCEEVPEKIKNSDVAYLNTQQFFEEDKTFDVIYLRHVLEHVYNPVEFLKEITKHLTPDGVLVIEVPNINNGTSRVFGKFSASIYAPYHLQHFTEDNLKVLLDKLGCSYETGSAEMPLMSNHIANFCAKPLNNTFRLLGVLTHPLQLFFNFVTNSYSVITAKIRIKNC